MFLLPERFNCRQQEARYITSLEIPMICVFPDTCEIEDRRQLALVFEERLQIERHCLMYCLQGSTSDS